MVFWSFGVYIWLPEATAIKGKTHLWMWCGFHDPTPPLNHTQGGPGPLPLRDYLCPSMKVTSPPTVRRSSGLTWLNCSLSLKTDLEQTNFLARISTRSSEVCCPMNNNSSHLIEYLTVCHVFVTPFTYIMSLNLQMILTGWVLLLLCLFYT